MAKCIRNCNATRHTIPFNKNAKDYAQPQAPPPPATLTEAHCTGHRWCTLGGGGGGSFVGVDEVGEYVTAPSGHVLVHQTQVAYGDHGHRLHRGHAVLLEHELRLRSATHKKRWQCTLKAKNFT